MIKIKSTKKHLDVSGPNWYPIQYADYFDIQTQDSYDGYNIFNFEETGLAENNAILASKAPDLLKQVDLLIEALQVAMASGKYMENEEKQLFKVTNDSIDLLNKIVNECS